MSRFTTTVPTRGSSVRSPVSQGSSVRNPASHASSVRRAAVALAATLLAGCATYGPGNLSVGQTEADALAKLGQPTERASLPGGGTRLDFARGPYGPHTYRVELDASGRIGAIGQLLTEANFATVRPNMASAEARERLGRPSETRGGWRGVGEVWSYRHVSPFCKWFQVWIVDGRVREAAYADDPLCDEKRRISGD
jgi:hypothetical protein